MKIHWMSNCELDLLIDVEIMRTAEFTDSSRVPVSVPYCSDRTACSAVLKRLGELGTSTSSNPQDHPWMLFVAELSRILNVEWRNGDIGAGQVWALINATPRQLMEAAYTAYKEWAADSRAAN